ncbi:MAG TPA: VCBS repeat-containing protein [Vicinamibacterales bacterium]|nr:VCBS repeat-containing protein [Vicinamibacterales bacterium]
MTIRLVATVLCLGTAMAAQSPAARDLRRTALAGTAPSAEIIRLDVDGDGRPDIIERWWNGKRVRWLDENGDLSPTDTRGDQVADVLQVDMNGDGWYDGVTDQNVKWADNDGDGRPDVQAWATQPPSWSDGKWSTSESHWMLVLDVEQDGVLGWQDWRTFNFGDSNWDYTGTHDWLPDYHGDALFLKIHRPPQALPDPRLNWENPFAFFDTDGDGLTEMGMRWLDPMTPVVKGLSPLSGVLNEAFLTLDLDNDSGKGNEIDYDMSLRGSGGPGVPYQSMVTAYPALRGNPKFDACFQWGNWRQAGELKFMPHARSYDAFFTAGWTST